MKYFKCKNNYFELYMYMYINVIMLAQNAMIVIYYANAIMVLTISVEYMLSDFE